MAHTVFTNGITLSDAVWFNDIDTVAYTYFGNGTNLNAPTQVAVTKGVFSTSVVTPLVQTTTDVSLDFGINSVQRWRIQPSTGGVVAFAILPFGDNTQQVGSAGNRVSAFVGPIIDSGSGTLILKGAGSTALTITGANAVFAGTLSASNLSNSNTGDQTITLTGGVTGSGTGSFATTVITNANLTGPITSVGNVTSIASGNTYASPTFTGTVSGTPTWASNQAITLSTAAQANVTSLGTLTSLTTSGTVTMTAAASKIVPGATSFSHRNNADSADNLLVTDAGALTGRTTITATTGMAVGGATAGAGGIAFPATAVSVVNANTLDDYKEGTWTPSLGGTTIYATQVGEYTKIGRLVFITGTLSITSIGTGSTTTISGLPFTPNPSVQGSISVIDTSTLATNVVSIGGRVSVVPDSIEIRSRTAASGSDSGNSVFGNATFMRFAGCYTTAT